jgi:hypothetical protein
MLNQVQTNLFEQTSKTAIDRAKAEVLRLAEGRQGMQGEFPCFECRRNGCYSGRVIFGVAFQSGKTFGRCTTPKCVWWVD